LELATDIIAHNTLKPFDDRLPHKSLQLLEVPLII